MSVILRSINIISFGQFENLRLDFDDSFNLIYGSNEAGKSTIVSFIEGILYGFDKGTRTRTFNEKKEKYKPAISYKYAGTAIFSKDHKDYEIRRNFETGDFEIIDLELNQLIEGQNSNLSYPGEFLLGINYEVYKNLISSYQSQESTSKARANITEVLKTQDPYNFRANEAIKYIDKALEDIGSNRAPSKPYLKTKNKLDKVNADLNELKSLRASYKNDFVALGRLQNEIENKNKTLKDLKIKRDSYRENIAYQNLEDEIKYQNELNMVNAELKNYKDVDFSKDVKNTSNNSSSNILIYFIVAAVLLIVSLISKKYLLIIPAVIIALAGLLLKNKNNPLPEEPEEMYNARRYEDLLKDKKRIEEILRVLQNQDKTRDIANMVEIKNIDIRAVEKDIRILEEELVSLNDKNLKLEKKLAAVEDRLAGEVRLVDKKTIYEANLLEMEKNKEALNLAKAFINEIKDEDLSDIKSFEDEISELINAISRGKYERVTYDKDLIPAIRTADGLNLSLDKLSTGFYDQLNFAFKFAINEKTNDNFIIFDDAFINYDLERLRQAMFFLLDLGLNRQIIYMTCHLREIEILRAEAIDYNFINLNEFVEEI